MELDFNNFDAAINKQPFWARLNPFHGELSLRSDAPEEVMEKAADHHKLVRWHGWRRVLSFYEEQAIPHLEALPPATETQRARFTVACLIAAMRAETEPGRSVTRLARDLANGLTNAPLDNDFKKKARSFLAAQLSKAAQHMDEAGRAEEAAQAYEVLKLMGRLSASDRACYARLLWREKRRGPQAMPIYLDHLNDCRRSGATNPDLTEISQFVAEQMTIDEVIPRAEIPQRLLFNQLACSRGDGSSTNALFHAGVGYLRLADPQRALSYLRRIPDNQDRGQTLFYTGQALFQIGDFAEAAQAFEQAAAEGYSRSRIASWQAMSHAKAGQWDKAWQTFQSAEAELGEIRDSEFYLQWGRACFLKGDAGDAENQFRRALDLDADNWRASYGLAICHEQLGRRDEAVSLLRKTTDRCGDAAPAFHLLGRLLQAEGNTTEAVAGYRQAASHSDQDAEYALSLGLALDDLGEAEGLSYLEQAAQSHAGGPEVIRRLALGYQRQGNIQRMRYWLNRLAARTPVSQSVRNFQTRDLASQAIEAFNTGDYERSVLLWEQVGGAFVDSPQAREGLAMALVHSAAGKLRRGEMDGVWEQIERAHQLSSGPETQFLYGFSRLMLGDFSSAHRIFSGLVESQPERAEHRFFESLSAYFAGDEGAAERLSNLDSVTSGSDLNSLLAFLQVQLAALRGDFRTAAEKVETWVGNQNAVRSLGLPRHQVNALAALCKIRGTPQRKQRIVVFFEKANEQYGDDYWGYALTLVKHHLAVSVGVERAAAAETAKLEECAAAYRDLARNAEAEEQRALLSSYAGLLQFVVCHRIGQAKMGAALEALDELRRLPLPASREIEELHALLTGRMAIPSHENAYAVVDREPDRAREIWRTLYENNGKDPVALHHLACLSWSRAYDETIAQHYEGSIPFWREGLEWYRKLYEREDYWESLQRKGGALGQTAAHPFDEAAFGAWRRDALGDLARTVLSLIFHVTVGVDQSSRGHEINRQVGLARSLMEIIRSDSLNATIQDRLAEELAGHYLDPDPTNLPDLEASVRRAGIALDIDADNLKSRIFLLRAITHSVNTQHKEGEKNLGRLADKLTEIGRHAEWLESRLSLLPEDRRARVKSDLISYYDQLGKIKHSQGQQATTEAIEAQRALENSSQYEIRRRLSDFKLHLERIRQCYQASDGAFQRSQKLDPMNPVAQDLMRHHREQYQEIEGALNRIA